MGACLTHNSMLSVVLLMLQALRFMCSNPRQVLADELDLYGLSSAAVVITALLHYQDVSSLCGLRYVGSALQYALQEVLVDAQISKDCLA